jgi:hypothetical protein
MPLLNVLEFTKKNLAVSYRASEKPQDLHVDVELSRPRQTLDLNTIQSLGLDMGSGAAGSDVFPPSAGTADLLAPTGPLPKATKKHRITYRVASIAPIYVRLLVEQLRAIAETEPLAGMQITGDLPLDATPLSVNEATVRKWLDDPAAYPKRWPKLAYRHEVEELDAKGVSARVRFARDVPPAFRKEMQFFFLGWRNIVVNYVSPEGEFIRQKLGPTVPKCAGTKREVTMSIEDFEHTRRPSADLLLNMLQKVHDEKLPIESAVLQF